MIDIVFQLLIFFLVASEVRPTEADFETNIQGGTCHIKRDHTKFVVARVYLRNVPDGDRVQVSLNGEVLAGDAFKTVETRIRTALGAMKSLELLVVIDGEPDVSLQGVSDALDSVIAGGATNIAFGKPAR